jgi:hypothetical protein
VAFASGASNLVADDTNGAWDVFLRDTCLGAPAGCTPSTVRVSVASDGTEANAYTPWISPSVTLSADGRFVAFDSDATNLVAGGPSGVYRNVFVRDTCVGAPAGCTLSTTWVSVASDGTELARSLPWGWTVGQRSARTGASWPLPRPIASWLGRSSGFVSVRSTSATPAPEQPRAASPRRWGWT